MDLLSNYDYQLPKERIAQKPLEQRDEARLLLVERETGRLSHRSVRDLPGLLDSGDCLVVNDTQVVPARLSGHRTATGGKWDGLYLGSTTKGAWRLIGQARGRLRAGEQLTIVSAHQPEANDNLQLTLLEQETDGVWIAEPRMQGDVLDLLERYGTVPLPPYIDRGLPCDADRERYQTTFAKRPGAVAAPTAGLHFTPQLFGLCRKRGIRIASVTLHIGIGTFRPVTVEKLSEHRMHAEWCELTGESLRQLNQTHSAGGRIVAVGTTSVRVLESAANDDGLRAWQGETELFIRPPYQFRVVDALLTNFHLPKSSLFILVCTFAGTELMKQAYQRAIDEKYRFYSYGDAMLIV